MECSHSSRGTRSRQCVFRPAALPPSGGNRRPRSRPIAQCGEAEQSAAGDYELEAPLSYRDGVAAALNERGIPTAAHSKPSRLARALARINN